jgi:hypothetical protein
MRQRDKFAVISRAIRSPNELKNRRGRNRELLSIQHCLGEISRWRLPLQRLTTVVVSIRPAVSKLRTPNRYDPMRVVRPGGGGSRRKRRSHVTVTDDICVDANHICARMLQSTFAFPPIDLSCSDRAAKQSPGLTNGFFQLCGIKPDGSAGRAL